MAFLLAILIGAWLSMLRGSVFLHCVDRKSNMVDQETLSPNVQIIF